MLLSHSLDMLPLTLPSGVERTSAEFARTIFTPCTGYLFVQLTFPNEHRMFNPTYALGWPEPYIYGVYTVFLAGVSLNIRLYTAYIYGSGQPY